MRITSSSLFRLMWSVPVLSLAIPLGGCFESAPEARPFTIADLASQSAFLKAAKDSKVKWRAWTSTTQEDAEKAKRPILFHVGDATCVECEVEDPFEDESLARLVNENSVPVRVDRELQPDVATFVQTMARAAGADLGPRHDVIHVTDADLGPLGSVRTRKPEELKAQLAALFAAKDEPAEARAWKEKAAKEWSPAPAGGVGTADLLAQSAEKVKSRFHAKHAGLDSTPKSPLDVPLRFLLRQYARSGDRELLQMVELTLKRASSGGIHDTKLKGFFHEALEENWNGVRGEKRLADQAQLAIAAMETAQVTGNRDYVALAQELLTVIQEMPAPRTVAENALAVSALARAGLLLNDKQAVQRAVTWGGSLAGRITGEGLSRTVQGSSPVPGYLEDYAYLTAALIDLYETTSDYQWLARAVELQERALEKFWDANTEDGAFFRASPGHALVPSKEKPVWDRRLPSGNAVAALNLLRLAELTSRKEFHEKAERTLKLLTAAIGSDPAQAGEALVALEFAIDRAKEIVIVTPQGQRSDAELLLGELRRHFVPNRVLLIVEAGASQEELSRHLPLIAKKYPQRGKATAYVCESGVCKFPTGDPEKFAKLLTEREKTQ